MRVVTTPAAPGGAGAGNKGIRALRAVLESETVLVTMMAIAMALSAFSVWQAARASDDAEDIGAEARVVQATTLRELGYLRTLVGHDLNVLRSYCDAIVQRDVAVASLLSTEPDVPGVVAGDSTVRALKPLLQGDAAGEPCLDQQAANVAGTQGYSIHRAQQSAWGFGQAGEMEGSEIGQAASLIEQAERTSSRERWLMTAGLVYAVALLGLIMIDVLVDRSKRPGSMSEQLVRRWRHGALASTLAALALGGGILLLNTEPPYLLGMGVLLGLVIAARGRSQVPRSIEMLIDPPLRRRSDPHWWAEILGALALVAFSACALGLSHVTVHEREARAESERQQVAAQQLLQAGEQDALANLAAVANLAVIDSQVAAAHQDGAAERAQAIAARRTVVAERSQAMSDSVRGQLSGLPHSATQDDCPVPPRDAAGSAEDLLEEGRADPQAFARYVWAQQEAAKTCDILSELTRKEATLWASHASTFTVALFILGLAGFLLTLASDPERSRQSARWLLWVGGLGMLVGLLSLLKVPVVAAHDAPVRDSGVRMEFAREVAAGRHAACNDAIVSLDRAIQRSTTYGPAFAARAEARLCSAASMPAELAMSSAVAGEAVPHILEDLEMAMKRGPVTPVLTGERGWVHILNGLQAGPDAEQEFRAGLSFSSQGIEMLERSSVSTLAIHQMRFNVGLAHVALDDHDLAEAAYDHALRCLDPRSGCAGGGLEDPQLRSRTALWALADLELLSPRSDVTSHREAIVAAFNPEAPGDAEWTGGELGIYPQEVQVAARHDGPVDSSVIWYHRLSDTSPWGVLEAPSVKTLHAGDHLNRPIAAKQLLPAGQYRADVYTGGRLTVSLSGTSTLGSDYARRSSPELSMSAVVPDSWAIGYETPGVDWSVNPEQSTGVVVRRKEGLTPDAEITPFLDGQLDRWVNERLNVDVTGQGRPAAGNYFLGLRHAVVREYEDLHVTAAAGFAPYASTPACGGTMIMAISGGTAVAEDVRRLVFESLVLDETPFKASLAEDAYQTDQFSIKVAPGWDAIGRPAGGTGAEFFAEQCETGANVIVNHEELGDRTLDSFVGATLREYADRDEFPGFKLRHHRAIAVPGSQEAVELVFSWRSENGPVLQRQVYAANDELIAYLTFTTHLADAQYFTDDAELIVDSFRLGTR